MKIKQPRRALTSIELTVPFHDNDPMGIVWHGNYYKYFEMARDALLERINWPISRMVGQGFGLPVIESRCRYRRSLHHLQKIRVDAWVSEWENRVCFRFEIYDTADGQLHASGMTMHAGFDMQKQELLFVLPENFQQAILQLSAEEEAAEKEEKDKKDAKEETKVDQ